MLDAIHSGLTIFEYFYHIPCIPGISSYIYVGTLKSLRDFYKLLSLTAITSLLNCFVDFVKTILTSSSKKQEARNFIAKCRDCPRFVLYIVSVYML